MYPFHFQKVKNFLGSWFYFLYFCGLNKTDILKVMNKKTLLWVGIAFIIFIGMSIFASIYEKNHPAFEKDESYYDPIGYARMKADSMEHALKLKVKMKEAQRQIRHNDSLRKIRELRKSNYRVNPYEEGYDDGYEEGYEEGLNESNE